MENKKYKIAIVDDENEILSMLQRYFNRNENYNVYNIFKSSNGNSKY